ncbi:MFS transporter [Dictyoglomus turgidum]|uniref:MFS transporter n=1 Tax=Dictyoglomus turgidum TaxID=513050 RepID=UPI0030811C72
MNFHNILGIFMNTLTTLSNVLILDYASLSSISKSFASTRVWAPIGFLVMMLTTGFYPKLTESTFMFPIISLVFLLCFLILLAIKELEFKVETKILTFNDVKRLISVKEVREFLLFMFFYSFALVGTSGNVNLLIKYLGGTNSDISWALVVCAAPEIPMSYFWGHMADKVGRKPLLLLAGLAMPIRSFLYFLTGRAFEVILIQFFTHIFTFVISINVAPIYVNDLVSPKERATGQGILNLSVALSQTLSSFISGNVANMVGLKGMYIFLAVIGLISAIWGLKIFRKSK